MKGDASRVQTSAQPIRVNVRPVPRQHDPGDPRDVVGDGRRLAVVATRVRREPVRAELSPVEVHALDTARRLRDFASQAFGFLAGIRTYDQQRVFGELLAYRSAVAMLSIGLTGPAHATLRRIEEELGEAVRWAIEAGPVAR